MLVVHVNLGGEQEQLVVKHIISQPNQLPVMTVVVTTLFLMQPKALGEVLCLLHLQETVEGNDPEPTGGEEPGPEEVQQLAESVYSNIASVEVARHLSPIPSPAAQKISHH